MSVEKIPRSPLKASLVAVQRPQGHHRRLIVTKGLKEKINKIGTLNLVLILVGTFFLWFNWQMILLFRECGSMPESYACAVIAATIGECGICGWIRTNKDKRQDRDWQKEDLKESQEPYEPDVPDFSDGTDVEFEQEEK